MDIYGVYKIIFNNKGQKMWIGNQTYIFVLYMSILYVIHLIWLACKTFKLELGDNICSKINNSSNQYLEILKAYNMFFK